PGDQQGHHGPARTHQPHRNDGVDGHPRPPHRRLHAPTRRRARAGPAGPRRAAWCLRNGPLVRIGFLLKEVLTGLRRNITMTVAMILTTAISIGLFGGGLLVVRLADNSRNIYLDRVESQVFLTSDVSANDPTCDTDPCKALRARIEGRDDVKSVRFLNRDEAYDDAIKKFPQYK